MRLPPFSPVLLRPYVLLSTTFLDTIRLYSLLGVRPAKYPLFHTFLELQGTLYLAHRCSTAPCRPIQCLVEMLFASPLLGGGRQPYSPKLRTVSMCSPGLDVATQQVIYRMRHRLCRRGGGDGMNWTSQGWMLDRSTGTWTNEEFTEQWVQRSDRPRG